MKIDPARLKEARIACALNPAELAVKLGLSKRNVEAWEAGKYGLTMKNLRRLAEELKVPEEFLTGAKPIYQSKPHEGLMLKESSARRNVPVVSWAAAGAARDYEDIPEQIDQTVASESRDRDAFAIIAEGDSMEPRIEAGDLVVLEPHSVPRNGDVVVARLNEGGVLLKRFRRTGREGKTILLESINPRYESKEYPESDFLFIYPASEFKGRLRR